MLDKTTKEMQNSDVGDPLTISRNDVPDMAVCVFVVRSENDELPLEFHRDVEQ